MLERHWLLGGWREYLRQRPRVPGMTVRAVAASSTPTTDDERIFIEPRWPLALVVGFYLVISVILRIAEPDRPSIGPHWLAPAIEAGLLLGESRPTRATSLGAPLASQGRDRSRLRARRSHDRVDDHPHRRPRHGRASHRVRVAAPGVRRTRVARQRDGVQPRVLAVRQRRPARALPARACASRPAVHAAGEPRVRAAGLAARSSTTSSSGSRRTWRSARPT